MKKFYVFWKKLTMWLMAALITLFIIWISVYVIKTTFKYTIFSSLTDSFFQVSIIAIIGLLCSLTVINVAANLNIISEAISNNKGLKEEALPKKIWWIVGGGFAGFIILLTLSMHIVNSFNTTKTSRNIVSEITRLQDSHSVLISKIADNIVKESNLSEIREHIKLINSDAPTIQYLQVIFPKEINGKLVYLRLTEYGDMKTNSIFSPLSDATFVATKKPEIEYLAKLKTEVLKDSKVFIERPAIKVYAPIYKNGKLVFILYSSYNEIKGRYLKYKDY